jgi:hypothetical protein
MKIEKIEQILKNDNLSESSKYSIANILVNMMQCAFYNTRKSNQIESIYKGEDLFSLASISSEEAKSVDNWANEEVKKASDKLEEIIRVYKEIKEWYENEYYFRTSKKVEYPDGLFNKKIVEESDNE